MNILKVDLLKLSPAGSFDGNMKKGMEQVLQGKGNGGGYRAVPGNVQQWI